MSVSVRMPQLGESVTEGTVTRWLKKEGDLVKTDEPLLEVSTDKVDTEIPSPASGVLRGIVVAEEETVEVGAELAVIEEEQAAAPAQRTEPPKPAQEPAAQRPPTGAPSPAAAPAEQRRADGPTAGAPQAEPARGPSPEPSVAGAPARQWPDGQAARSEAVAPAQQAPPQPLPPQQAAPAQPAAPPGPAQQYPQPTQLPGTSEGTYITPLVRKLAAEHGVDLSSVQGTGVGGRIRKQDVLDASRARRSGQQWPPAAEAEQPAATAAAAAAPPGEPRLAATPQAEPAPGQPSPAEPTAAAAAELSPAQPAPAQPAVVPAAPQGPAAAPGVRPQVQPSPLRGTTERMSRLRQLIAQRMVDSLRVSAQLSTVVETDVTKIARLRERAKSEFEARQGVRLSFLPFFALATLEALKMHPRLNAVIDTEKSEVTYHDAEHLGIAVDTERGLLVPVIRNAGDLNIGGLARKIDDLARRTRAAQVSPDELSGGTFTLTNTGSRGVIFDTPIINQPQVAILGTGAVVKRPVVVEDPALGEVIAVRSMVYLVLTYDHRLVDGADAARFLAAIKTRLEDGAFEAELGL